MDLFLLRHGSAHPDAEKDSERALNAVGREEVERIVKANAGQLHGVTQVLVSPYLRARQTSEIALTCLATGVSVLTVADLVPNANPQRVIDLLAQAQYPSVLCVSHQPLLGTLLDELCDFEPGQYRIATGSLVHIHFPQGMVGKGLGNLRWLKQP